MRAYPRSFVGPDGVRKRVFTEMEEYELGLKGYERHRNPEINKRQKGTDKEILRVKPEEPSEIIEMDTTTIKDKIPTEIKEAVAKPLTRGQKAWATRKRNQERKALEGV